MMQNMPDFEAISLQYAENKEKFDAFYRLLLEYNQKFNLTSVTEEREVFHKHFLDSLAGEGFLPQGATCAEVGSGAGFPSVPLKIVRGDLKLTLIESTGKKCGFLRTVVSELGLKEVEVVNARAEEVGRDGARREKYDVCFARAVARLNTLAEYCMPLVRQGGIFLAYKGDSEEELEEARHAFSVLGGGTGEAVRYELPDGYGARMLISVKKERRTPKEYPRGQGLERRKPL